MMSGVKLEVLWSPIHHDKFILWGPDITLYEVSRIKEIEKKTTFTPISSTRGATVLASQSASGVRCADISAIPEQPEPLLALGYASGRVALTTLKQTYDPLGLVGREFSPRYPRLCNSVSWSHMETNMLAVAMEKHRSDHCILLWDVYRGSTLSEEAKPATDTASSSSATEPPRPLAEMGLSETAHSVTWANFSNRTLIASMNLKYIKIFDLRDLSNKAVNMTTTRYCYGVCAEPCGGYQLASRGEGVACVWDARALQRPLLTMQHPKPLAQLQWCPTRYVWYQLASRGEGVACVWDARALQRPLLTMQHPKPLAQLQWCPTRYVWYQLASRGEGVACVWDARALQRPLLTMQHPKPLAQLQWCPTRYVWYQLASRGEGVACVWDARALQRPLLTMQHPKPLAQLQWCPTRYVWYQLASRGEGVACVWDARALQRPLLTMQHPKPLAQLQWCPTRYVWYQLASRGEGVACVWDARALQRPLLTMQHPKPLAQLQWCPTRYVWYQLASRGEGVACVWDARALQRPLLTMQHPKPLAQLQWCPTRYVWYQLASRGEGVACVWDARALQRPLLTMQHPKPLAQLQWCPTRYVWYQLASRGEGVACVWDARALQRPLLTMQHPKPLAQLQWCPTRYVWYQLASRGEGVACVWDARALQRPLLTMQHPKPLAQLQWCPTRYVWYQLASRGEGVACVWDARALQRPLLTMQHPKPLAQLQWCPTRYVWYQLASRGEGVACVWDARALQRPLLTMQHPKPLAQLQWCPTRYVWYQLASRGEGEACVWDARALQRPLLTMQHPKPLAQLQWCPTRRNLLVSLQRDSSTLRIHDIQQANSDNKVNISDSMMAAPAVEAELEEQYSRGPSVIERDVCVSSAPASPLVAFTWHPTHEGRMLAVCATGALVDYTVCERVTVSWGGGGSLVWTGGGGALRLMNDDFYAAIKDISYVMKKRAQTDYGLKPDLWQNADLADDDSLSGLWHFMALSKSLVEDGCIRNSPWKHPGVRGVLRSVGDGGYRSEIVPSLLPDLPSRRVTVYRSAERTRALQLCGWGWGWENALAGVERAEAEGTPCRAAALAAFQLRVRAALDVLARAREPVLRVVALALAGLSDERLWREALAGAAAALPDPYLRALLRFLAASAPAHPHHHPPAPHHPDLAAVLNETEMRLEDRVAFACIFLSDAKLHEYIRQTCDSLVEQGDLSGILLTGASTEGIALLQRWVENTGDVQSVALLSARCFTAELLRDARVRNWLDSYRSILDSWQLWWARCALDTWVCGAEGGAELVPRHVCVACSYCGKSVAAPPGHNRPRVAFQRLPPPAAKMKQISSCPNCRKPLPRCGVCSLHVGTAGGGAGGAGGGGAAGAAFSSWFSWCVACRHGGHAMHLINWFKEHKECPVSSCNCHCATLDPPDRH